MVTAARVDTKVLLLIYRVGTNFISLLALFQLAQILLIKYQFTEVLSSLDDRCGEKAQKKKQYSTMWQCMRTGRTLPQVRFSKSYMDLQYKVQNHSGTEQLCGIIF